MDGVKLPADLDELLRQTLAQEPSIEFLPRIRERIATERVTARWSWRPIALAGAATAAAIALAIAVVPRLTDDVTAPPAPAQPHAVHGTAVSAPAKPPMAEAPVLVGEAVRAAARPQRVGVPPKTVEGMPPVIVDERQEVALGRIVRLAAEGRLGDEDLVPVTPASLQPIRERLGDIAVRPVEVSPIGAGGVLQVGPEPKQPPRPAELGFNRP